MFTIVNVRKYFSNIVFCFTLSIQLILYFDSNLSSFVFLLQDIVSKSMFTLIITPHEFTASRPSSTFVVEPHRKTVQSP